jgi:hypothetical protein
MIYFLIIFITICFMQTTFLPINLALVLIIARSLLVEDRRNYIIAVIGGVILGLLASQNIGVWALVFLIITKAIFLVKKLPVSAGWIFIFPVSGVIIILASLLEGKLLNQNLNTVKIVIEVFMTVPIYILMKYTLERFGATSEIKLKLNR